MPCTCLCELLLRLIVPSIELDIYSCKSCIRGSAASELIHAWRLRSSIRMKSRRSSKSSKSLSTLSDRSRQTSDYTLDERLVQVRRNSSTHLCAWQSISRSFQRDQCPPPCEMTMLERSREMFHPEYLGVPLTVRALKHNHFASALIFVPDRPRTYAPSSSSTYVHRLSMLHSSI